MNESTARSRQPDSIGQVFLWALLPTLVLFLIAPPAVSLAQIVTNIEPTQTAPLDLATNVDTVGSTTEITGGTRPGSGTNLYAGLVSLFVIVEYLPVRATDDVTAYYNGHARQLNKKGFEQEAMAYWEQSSSMNKPFSAFANLELAYKYFGKKNFARASAYLDKIPESSFAAARKYELAGDLLARQGQVAEAVAAYERSLAINAGSERPRRQLIRIFEGIDPDRAQREREALSEIASFYRKP